MVNKPLIKIEVVTGFLGAGKTTFIKKLIESGVFKKEKVIIIENEFGDISVDHKLLAHDEYDLIELSGGCICCSVKSSLIDTLIQLAQNEKPDRIIIEPSGVFVAEELKQVMGIEAIKTHYYVSGIYTIIDPRHFSIEKMRQAPFYMSQIKYADHIFLRHVDGLEFPIDILDQVLEKVNPVADYHFNGIQHWSIDELKQLFCDKKGQPFYERSVLYHPHSHTGLTSVSLKEIAKLSNQAFDLFKEEVLKQKYGEILRIKGYLMIDGISYLVNFVQGSFTLVEDFSQELFLTIIGYDLVESNFQDLFK
jgi:G3E family GTPase